MEEHCGGGGTVTHDGVESQTLVWLSPAHSKRSCGLPHALPGLGAAPPPAVLATSKLLYPTNFFLSPVGVSWSPSKLQRTRVPLV